MLMTYGNDPMSPRWRWAPTQRSGAGAQEAEGYQGPSVIITYTPYLTHGIRAGMAQVQEEMKRAVDSGYWLLYRYDPRRMAIRCESSSRHLCLDMRLPRRRDTVCCAAARSRSSSPAVHGATPMPLRAMCDIETV